MFAVVRSGEAFRDQWGALPAADSQGMAERNCEREYVGIRGDQPVLTSHTTAGLLLYAAEDAINALARLYDESFGPPVFAHMTLARSVLECSARARWMAECSAGVRGRIARLLANRVADLAARIDVEERVDRSVAQSTGVERDLLLERALDSGFARRTQHGAIQLEERVPRYRALVEQLFAHTEFGGDQVATVAYAHYSGVLHGRPWALVQSIDRTGVEPPNELRGGVATAPIVTTDINAIAVMAIVTAGYIEAVDELGRLMGWDHTADWTVARADAMAAFADALRG